MHTDILRTSELAEKANVNKETIRFYEKKGLGVHIDANQNPESVFKEIQQKVF